MTESRRREAPAWRVAKVLREVRRLRQQGARARLGFDPGDDEPEAPPGGWKPIFDDDGRVIPDPPPSQPTDVPAAEAEAAKAEADLD